MTERRSWIWIRQNEELVTTWSLYDHARSTFEMSSTLDQDLSNNSGTAFFNCDAPLSYVEGFHCLPSGSTPVVDNIIQEIIIRVAGIEAVQFYPVLVDAKDGTTAKFSFVIPRRTVSCTDLERSKVSSWIVPGDWAADLDSLRHKPGCMGDMMIARDAHWVNQVIVSDALKQALLEINDLGVNFCLPEDYPFRPAMYS